MGSYCKYCGRRCFVVRTLPADSTSQFAGQSICLATCSRGMEHDRKATGGYDHTNTVNPVTGLVHA